MKDRRARLRRTPLSSPITASRSSEILIPPTGLHTHLDHPCSCLSSNDHRCHVEPSRQRQNNPPGARKGGRVRRALVHVPAQALIAPHAAGRRRGRLHAHLRRRPRRWRPHRALCGRRRAHDADAALSGGCFFSFLFLSFFLRGDVSERGCCCRDRPRCSRRAAAGGRLSSTPPRRPQERWPLRPSEWTCTSRTARCSSSSPTQ